MTAAAARESWRCCTRATPYQRGYEDCCYQRIYANPYRADRAAWHAYDRGNADARRNGAQMQANQETH